MEKKTILAIIILILVAIGILLYEEISKVIIKEVTDELPISCTDDTCSTCMIHGNICNCNTINCQCGNITVNKTRCE